MSEPTVPVSPAIVTGKEYLTLPRAPETWLVEGLLPTSGSMLIFGDPKVGKSYAALQLAGCLASGREWLGFGVPKSQKVVYVQLDTPRTLWAERVQTLVESGHDLNDVLFADRETLNAHPFDILNPDHFKLLSTSLAAIEPGVVIFDTIRESHSGDENDSTEMQEVISHLASAVKPAALILISHARKSNPEYGYDLMNDNRGSNYLVGRMDAIVRMSKKSMRYSSRTLEEQSISLERSDDGTWSISEDPFKGLAEMIILGNPDKSQREMAELLASKTGKEEEACRSYIRRRMAKGVLGRK